MATNLNLVTLNVLVKKYKFHHQHEVLYWQKCTENLFMYYLHERIWSGNKGFHLSQWSLHKWISTLNFLRIQGVCLLPHDRWDHQILYQPCHLLKMAPNIFWHLCLTQPIHWLQIERNIYACTLQESCEARDDSVRPTLSTTVCFHVFKKPSVGFSTSISDLVPLYYVL